LENTNLKVYIEKNTETQNYGCLYIEPLERGYGDTVGNALRRLLLSSIKGVAVTSVRIDGVLHEFSTIPGVREDVIEILMNLKHIPIKAKTEKPQLKPEGYKLVTLDSDELPKSFFTREENPGVITAKDLPWDNDFEFCGDGVLCTLEPGAHLVMEIYIEPGVGYLSAERERPSHLPLDALLTDAIFSPVKRVNYRIEPARVGQSIDYERLILEVWTNGAISPGNAVKQASEIARNYFAHVAENIIIEDTVPSLSPEQETELAPAPDPLEKRPIHDLGLSSRSENRLKEAGIETIGQLMKKSREDLLQIDKLGKKSLTEIEEKLESRTLRSNDDKAEFEDKDEHGNNEQKFKDAIDVEDVAGTEKVDEVTEESQSNEGEKLEVVKTTETKKPSKPKTPKTKTAKAETAAKTEKKTAKSEAKAEDVEAVEQAKPAETVKKSSPKKSSSSKTKKATEEPKPEVTEKTEAPKEKAEKVEKAEKPKKPKKSTKKAKEETAPETPENN